MKQYTTINSQEYKEADQASSLVNILDDNYRKRLVPTTINLQPLYSYPLATPKLAHTVDHVLSHHECASLIARSEEVGYTTATVNIGNGKEALMTNYRKSLRCIIDDKLFVQALWPRIRHLFPETFDGHTVVGLNERLRFLKYGPQDEFKPHMDGSFWREDGSNEMSLITIQFYLNDGFEGGSTTFLDRMDKNKRIEAVPKTGMALIFEHALYHEGSVVKSGTKYAIRTDVMYKPLTK